MFDDETEEQSRDHLRLNLTRAEHKTLTADQKRDRKRHLAQRRSEIAICEIAAQSSVLNAHYQSPVEHIKPTITIDCSGHLLRARRQQKQRTRP